MNPFTASARTLEPMAVIDCAGQLDGGAAEALDAAVDIVLGRPDTQALLLAMADVTYINSTGIALLVGLLARARAAEVPVLASGLTPHYRHVFDLTRLTDFMRLVADEAEAHAALRPTP